MNNFRILDGAVPEEREYWLELWDRLPSKEVSAHPDYARLFTGPHGSAICATLSDPAGIVMFPLIRRAIHHESWAFDTEKAYDLTTPYGYGGAFVSGAPAPALFWSAMERWASEERIVSLFGRLSLFPEQILPSDWKAEIKATNIVRNLELTEEEIWMDYKHKVRKNVKIAHGAGVTVEVDTTGARLTEFLEIYHHTLKRRNASGEYYFPQTLFSDLIERLPKMWVLFHALKDKAIIASELVLVSEHHIYSFLGGTISDRFPLRPNDFLKHQITLWGRRNGKKAFVLGGGYANGDGIFRYKQSFAPTGEVPFRVLTRVFDQEKYRTLVNLRKRREEYRGRKWEPPTFFPEYRASGKLVQDVCTAKSRA